jgi:pentatricopeptide repeat protein
VHHQILVLDEICYVANAANWRSPVVVSSRRRRLEEEGVASGEEEEEVLPSSSSSTSPNVDLCCTPFPMSGLRLLIAQQRSRLFGKRGGCFTIGHKTVVVVVSDDDGFRSRRLLHVQQQQNRDGGILNHASHAVRDTTTTLPPPPSSSSSDHRCCRCFFRLAAPFLILLIPRIRSRPFAIQGVGSICTAVSRELLVRQASTSSELVLFPEDVVDLEEARNIVALNNAVVEEEEKLDSSVVRQEEAEEDRAGNNKPKVGKPCRQRELGVVAEMNKVLKGRKWGSETVRLLEPFAVGMKEHHVSEIVKRLKDVDMGLSFFNWVCQNAGHIISSHTFTVMIGRLGSARRFNAMRQLLEDMRDSGLDVTAATYLALVRSYGR